MIRQVSSALFSVLAFILVAAPPAAAQSVGQPILALLQGTNTLVRFTTATPGTLEPPVLVTGMVAGDTLRAIDYRPVNGLLYGLATDASNAVVRLYVINATTGVATGGSTPVTLPTPATLWDINFNPVVDRVRVVNDQDENARLVPDTGALAADDANLSPPTVTVDAIAYTNPVAGAASTTLYALNQTTNSLATIGGVAGTPSPNTGVVTDIGPLGITFAGSPTALDIATTNTAFAVLRPVSGATSLYSVDLGIGTATLIGAVGDGTLVIDDIAVVDPGLTLSPPTGTYTSQQSFDLVLLAEPQGRTVTGGTVTFDGFDVTGFVVGCLRPGTGAGGVQSFRCADIGGPVIGPGTHTFQVQLVMNDGSVVQRTVTWNGGTGQRALTTDRSSTRGRGRRRSAVGRTLSRLCASTAMPRRISPSSRHAYPSRRPARDGG